MFNKKVNRNFRRVTFTISTGFIDISEWNKINDLIKEIAGFIRARGCTFVAWKIEDTNGVGSVSFKPNHTDISILKRQIEELYPEITIFVRDTAEERKETVEVTEKTDEK